MSKNNKKLLIYLLVLAVPFSFLFLGQSITQSVRMHVAETTSLPMRVLLFPVKEMKKIITYHRTFRQYRQLQNEVDGLRAGEIGREELMRENDRLRRLLDFKKNFVFSSVAAHVIGRDPSNWNAAVMIDRGSNDGVTVGMPVVASGGVVGKVSEVGGSTSKVMLLSDPNFSVAALLQRTREEGLVSGTLSGMCRMHYLAPEADIAIGDKVVTSKLSSSFPEGLLIGEVIEAAESQSSPTLECLIEPAVALTQLEEVLIIKKR